MEISVNEFVDLKNTIDASNSKAYEAGVKDESDRAIPYTLFDAIFEYAQASKTLIDYHKIGGDADGCNWIQVKPTRDSGDGGKTIDFVEISFESNLMDINYIGGKIKK